MRKKLLCTMLCVTMLASALTGCGSSEAPKEDAPVTEGGTEAGGDASKEEVTLTFWGWEASKMEGEAIQRGIDAFEDLHPEIHVDFMTVPSADFHTKLKTALASGDGPDVFYLDAMYCKDFVKAGLLMDLTEPAAEVLGDMTRASREKVSIPDENGEEHMYGIDICNVGPVIFYNKDLFEAAGVEPMPTRMEDRWTWDEFVENMKKLTIVDDSGNTVQYGTTNWQEQYSLYVLQYMLELNGANWYNEDMTAAQNVNSPEARAVLESIKALREQGIAPDPNAAGSDTGNSPTSMFLTGKVATIAIGSYALQELAASDINLGVGLFPTFGKDDADAMIVSADMKAINKETEHPEEALLLATYMSSVDFGIPIYKTGLWMPSRTTMYEADNLELWFDREIYPEGWENLLDVFQNAKNKPTDKLSNTMAVNAAVDEELHAFYYTGQDVETTLQNIEDRINAVLK